MGLAERRGLISSSHTNAFENHFMRTRAARPRHAVAGWLRHAAVLLVAAGCRDSQGPGGPEPLNNQIVFVSDRSGAGEIWVMSTTGANPRQLTFGATNPHRPKVSPDGSAIVFASGIGLQIMQADGSDRHAIPGTAPSDFPAWSPDGKRVAFVSDRDGNLEIYSINTDGTGVVRLTNDPAQDFAPAWSPDGKSIVFSSDRDDRDFLRLQLFVVNVDGTGLHSLSNNLVLDCCAAWAHDGRTLGFDSIRDLSNQVFLMDADGGRQRPVSNRKMTLGGWSPDDTRLVVTDISGLFPVIATIDLNGANYLPLTNGEANDRDPVFSP